MYILYCSSPSLNIYELNLLHTPVSSSLLIRPLRTARQGMLMKMSESHISTISPKALYLREADSMARLRDCRCESLSSSQMCSFASVQDLSRSPRTSWSS